MAMSPVNKPLVSNWTLVFFCWLIACASTLGSLFFSDIMELPPCTLCWYQRVFMYPLVIIYIVALFPYDRAVLKYSIPLTIVGWLFAAFHVLIYSGIIPERIQPCSKGVSCSQTYLDIFGFITIPLLSLASFSILAVMQLVVLRRAN